MTDEYAAKFAAGLANAQGSLDPAGRAAAGPALHAISTRLGLRAEGLNQVGTASALKVFDGYNAIMDDLQNMIELEAATLFIMPAGRGTCVALMAEAEADHGQIAYELAILVKRVGQHMIADTRFRSTV